LARERRRITAGDVVRAAMTATGEDGLPPLPESKLVDVVIEPAVKRAASAFLSELDALTIDDLCRRAEAEDAIESAPMADFAI
jgi:DNA-binding IscR family transcriptional regulator